MQTRLVPIGNSFGVRLPKSIIKQFDLDKGYIHIAVKKEGILISPVSDIPPLHEWDSLFKKAKKKGFNAKQDAADFSDWNLTMSDGAD